MRRREGRISGQGRCFRMWTLRIGVRADHPLCTIREIANAALVALGGEFEAISATGVGRPSIPPERLLRAQLLQAFYGVCSGCARSWNGWSTTCCSAGSWGWACN